MALFWGDTSIRRIVTMLGCRSGNNDSTRLWATFSASANVLLGLYYSLDTANRGAAAVVVVLICTKRVVVVVVCANMDDDMTARSWNRARAVTS